MKQLRIPAVYMRGGTSKGVFFLAEDLPVAQSGRARDALLMRVIGSPDPYGKQIDGMGGATSSTSKIVILSKVDAPGLRRRLPVRPGRDRPAVRRLVAATAATCQRRGRAVRDQPTAWSSRARARRHGDGAHLAGQHRQDDRQPRADERRRGAGDGRLRARRRDLPGGRGRSSSSSIRPPTRARATGGGAMFPTGNRIDELEVPGRRHARGDADQRRQSRRSSSMPRGSATRAPSCRTTINGDARRCWRMFETMRAHGAVAHGPDRATPRKRGQAPAHAQGRLRRPAGRLHRVQRQGAWRPSDDRPAGARTLDGQAAPRDDGHGRGGHRHGGGDSRARWSTSRPAAADAPRCASAIPPARCASAPRRAGGRPVDGHQGADEPSARAC